MNRFFANPKLLPALNIQSHLPVQNLLFISNHFKQFVKEKRFVCFYNSKSEDLSTVILKHNAITGHPITRREIQNNTRNTKTCWNCNRTLSVSLFCDSCKALQPVDKQSDYFNIMGVDRSYKLKNSELKQKFLNLQTLLHPDKFSLKPKKEQELSEEFSSIVNKAYTTLLEPLERGLYLLSLNNISIEEGTMDVDKMFLMEIMERNEEIENESDPQRLNEYYEANKKQLESLTTLVAEAFDCNDMQLAKKLLTKMKYYNTIDKKIKENKQKLNIPD